MKKVFILLMTLVARAGLAQVKPGDNVPDIRFTTMLNAPAPVASLAELKGKVVLLDFWATWCGSCIEAMPHLQALQQKYKGKLQVIAVGDEPAKRVAQYLRVKPSNFWFAVDTGRQVAALFPHQLIPHDILIGTDGRMIAATSPEEITDSRIDSILAGKVVHLAEKKDNLLSHDDLVKRYFFAADTVKTRFIIQGEIKGGPGLSNNWLTDPVFGKRRLTAVNLPLTTLYMLAYGNFPYGRTVDQVKAGRNAPRYSLDLIVAHPDELLPALRGELASRFDIQARVETVMKDVQVLRINDAAKFNSIPRNTSGTRTYMAMHGAIDQQSMTMKEFADFLENYGTGKLTVDDTGNAEKLDIKFTFRPEDPQSLREVLTGMGLTLANEPRNVDMLVLYRQ